jgi:hypothetical protein
MKSNGSGQENRMNGQGDPLCWPCDTLYPQKVGINFDKRRSLGIVCLWTKGHGVLFIFNVLMLLMLKWMYDCLMACNF